MELRRLGEVLGVGAVSGGGWVRWAPVVGVGVGIFLTGLISAGCVEGGEGLVLVASMGASAVLVFGAPASPFAQPWAVVMGHTVSALSGCLVVRWMEAGLLGGAVAVGLAMAAMLVFRCVHPPGGSTALGVVLSGMYGAQRGFGFALNPVFLNALVLVLTGVVWHRWVGKGHYPSGWKRG